MAKIIGQPYLYAMEGIMGKKLNGKQKGQRMIKEIWRLHQIGLGKGKIAKALGVSKNTVKKYIKQKNDGTSNTINKNTVSYHAPWSDVIDWQNVRSATNRGIQLQHYWEDHIQKALDKQICNIPYVSFWREYKRRYPDIPIDFHKIHPPGERCEVDYKGDSHGLGYINKTTGEYTSCRLFGSILCFSQLFYVRATLTERQEDLFTSIGKSYEYFGGVPHTTALDNTKPAVIKAHRYDPDLNPEFSHFCSHYGTAPLAMRPRKPKDKNLIENVLGVFWRWAGPKIRERTFFSLADLNRFSLELLDLFNNRLQRKYGLSRRQKFDSGEKDKLHVLPLSSYSYGLWRKSKPHPDCHIQIGYNFYSIPYQLRGKEVEVRISNGILEVFNNLERVACHMKDPRKSKGLYFTKKEHLPKAHLAIMETTPRSVINDAEAIGIATGIIVSNLIHNAIHPLMYLRRVQGILRLNKRYSKMALEEACQVILDLNIEMPKLRDVEDIVKNNIKNYKPQTSPVKRSPNPHLRGQKSWSSDLIN